MGLVTVHKYICMRRTTRWPLPHCGSRFWGDLQPASTSSLQSPLPRQSPAQIFKRRRAALVSQAGGPGSLDAADSPSRLPGGGGPEPSGAQVSPPLGPGFFLISTFSWHERGQPACSLWPRRPAQRPDPKQVMASGLSKRARLVFEGEAMSEMPVVALTNSSQRGRLETTAFSQHRRPEAKLEVLAELTPSGGPERPLPASRSCW